MPQHRAPDTAGAEWLWRAFLELSTCRTVAPGAVGPIPATAIWAYVDRYGLPEWVVDAIFSIDIAWLAGERAKVEQLNPTPPARTDRQGFARPALMES